jgi:hypothetical protein
MKGDLNDNSADEYCHTGHTLLLVNVECLEMGSDSSVSIKNSTLGSGLNVIEILGDSTLRNYHCIHHDVGFALGLGCKSVNLHLVTSKGRTR